MSRAGRKLLVVFQPKFRHVTKLLSLLLLGIGVATVKADDWAQFQGPNRDSQSTETGLLQEWPEGGPKMAWKINTVGLGYSCPAVVGDRIYTMGARDGKSELFALNAADGSEIWSLVLNEKPFDFKANAWGKGPRATPTVSDGMVYALAGDGVLVCADLDGQEKWRLNLQKDLGGEVNPVGGGPELFGWGFCWSPLVDGNQLICMAGGKQGLLLALDKKTGELLWRCAELPEAATYASPLKAMIHGFAQYVILTQSGVASVSPEGKLLWYYKRKRPFDDVVIPTPVIYDNKVYLSDGWGGAGCDLIEVKLDGDSFTAESIMGRSAARNMKNKQGGFVLLDGHIYGCSDRRGWVCQNLDSGKIAWYKKGEIEDGSIIYADNRLYVFGEIECQVGLLEVSAEQFSLKGSFILPEISKKRAPSGRAWTHPVIADGRLYLRDQELLYSYEIK